MRGRTVWSLIGLFAIAATACRPSSQSGQRGDSVAQHGLSQRDELLLASANIALPPPGVSPSDLPEPASQGAQLTARYCAQCHELPSPGMHSATDWPSIARRMWLRTELLSPALGVKVPTMAERFAILDYLTGHALQVSGANLPAGQGRDAFSRVCSQCHALPDPRVHSREDWPTVFARMERNMERMKVPPPAGTQTSDILLYLQTVAGRP
jgi:cytochrome c5